MVLRWENNFDIGIEEIDRHHMELFKKVNSVLETYEDQGRRNNAAQNKKEKMEDIFYFLTDYFKTHFDAEEGLQEEIGFPEFKEHKKSHREFIQRIDALKYKFLKLDDEEIDEELFLRINGQLLKWMVNHIQIKDKKMSDYLEESK